MTRRWRASAQPWHDDVVRVVVCDDHPMARRRLIVRLEEHAQLDVVAEAEQGEQAVALCRRFAPDVAVVGMRVSSIGGPRTAAGIREVIPSCAVAMVVTPDDEDRTLEAIEAGATGFIGRDSPEVAAEVVAAVARGAVVLPPLVAQRILAAYDQLGAGPFDSPVPAATDLERSLLGALALGQSYAGAAQTCGIEPAVARNLVANAVEKLYRLHRLTAVEAALGRVRPTTA